MRFLIAAVLVLSCVTAKADDIYIWGADKVERTAQLDKQKRTLIAAFEKNLNAKGHKVVKEWKPQTPQIGFIIIEDGLGTLGVAVTAVKISGELMGMSVIPNKGISDADWVARKVLQELGI